MSDDHAKWLDWAMRLSKSSPDPSTKCGAAIVRRGILVGEGLNDFPHGRNGDVVQSPDRWNNRELKYQFVVHAELNAILDAGKECSGATLYSWPPGHGPSCDRCAAHIVQAGIIRVVYKKADGDFPSRWKEACERGLIMLHEAGVEVIAV